MNGDITGFSWYGEKSEHFDPMKIGLYNVSSGDGLVVASDQKSGDFSTLQWHDFTVTTTAVSAADTYIFAAFMDNTGETNTTTNG